MSILGNRTRGLDYRQRIILYEGVPLAVLDYCASVYYPRLSKVYKQRLRTPNRKWLLRTIGGYGTISYEATHLIARVLPLDLYFSRRILLSKFKHYVRGKLPKTDEQFGLRFEYSKIYDSSDDSEVGFKIVTDIIHNSLYQKWQAEWDRCDKCRNTHRFFPSVRDRLRMKDTDINFHTTKILSGHGNFAQYLKRFHIVDDANCTDCKNNQIDSVEHALFECPAFADLRSRRKINTSFFNIGKKKISERRSFLVFAHQITSMKKRH
ncbi:UNVERIFIED_CONTAM: hypothetical protein PYX00_002625 [Menopon gallinae]|uniref:Reverse transcriptase zinc-binding domain-containing protein n=1 Tax=Menopon gallinae TaxID=328185 RepID=A0AAW2HYU6_9NEOP